MLSPPEATPAHSLLFSHVSGDVLGNGGGPTRGKYTRQNDLNPYGVILKLVELFCNQ